MSCSLGHPLLPGVLALLAAGPACAPPTPVLLHRARQAEATGHPGEACRLFGQALGRSDLDLSGRFSTLRARLRCAHRLGHLAALEAEARRAAAARPEDAEAHYVLALATLFSATGRSEEAVRHLESAAKAAPGEAEYPYRLGLVLLAAEEPEKAKEALHRAVRLRPRWAAPRVALARTFAERGDVQGARRSLVELPGCAPTTAQVAEASTLLATLARDADPIPPSARPLFDQAMKLLGQEFTAAAAAVLKKAHEEHPQVATFALLYGLSMVRLSNYGAALTLLTKAARLNPQDPSAPLHLASVLGELGRTRESIPYYEKATSLDPVSRRAWQGLGEALLTLKRTDEALVALERAAALSGRDPSVLRSLAQGLAASGRMKEAVALHRDALRRKPADVELRFELADLLVRRYRQSAGDPKAERLIAEARDLLRSVLKETPGHEAARALLRRLTAGAEGKERPRPR